MEKVVRVRRDDNQGPGGSLNVKCLFLKARFTGLFFTRAETMPPKNAPKKCSVIAAEKCAENTAEIIYCKIA